MWTEDAIEETERVVKTKKKKNVNSQSGPGVQGTFFFC